MQYTVREVARLLSTSENTVYRWIRDRSMPATRHGDQYRFNRTELLEWATARQIPVLPDIFRDAEGEQDQPSVAATLEAGGVYLDIPSESKEAALRAMVSRMPLPAAVNRDLLLTMLLAREEMASTAVGGGVAIPHVRNPIVLQVPAPMIALGFLRTPMDFGALDGKPVFALFTLISKTIRGHLHLISRLAFALHDAEFRQALARRAPAGLLMDHARRIEATFVAPGKASEA